MIYNWEAAVGLFMGWLTYHFGYTLWRAWRDRK